ncbi:MAG: 3-oxoadipate enol-lactone hydrolase [Solirubrobacterales bacterium 70-9]|nr:MAG: 3-oxoadipate enol-lactone hydrolase [Solirubrobacterales bacterium 70-9]
MFEHHTAAVKDVRLHYVRAGEGDPVVLLHGWPQTWWEWRHVIPQLAESHTLIVPDLRGLGASSKPDSGYDTDNVADDVHELVRSLGFESIDLAGHDWGAATAYSYAAQFRDEVRRLAIFEMVLPGFGIMEGAMAPQPGGNFLWHMGWQSVPDIPFALLQGREELYLRWFFGHYAYDPSAVSEEDIAVYVAAMTGIGGLRAGLEYYKAFFESASQNEGHRERPLDIPVLAWGGEACLGPLTKQCLEMAAGDVNGGVIERCGHWIGEERPEFIAAQLTEFFGADG